MTLVLGGVAWADNLIADGDGVVPVDNDPSLSLGNVCLGQSASGNVLLAINRVGEGNVYADSASVGLSASVTGGGLSQTFTDSSIALPGNWTSVGNNTLSSDTATSNVTVSVGSSVAIGAKSGTISYSAQGAKHGGGTLTRSVSFGVTWSVVSCTPSDSTAPQNASIDINAGDGWTNNTSVRVDIGATDNVGITKYRLAETQGDLATANDVAVTPTMSFGASAVSFTLSGADASTKSVWVRYFDAAGNSADASDTIGLDRTKPVISGSTGTYVPGTWTNQSVLVSFTCEDTGSVQSGIATDTVASGDMTLSADGEDQFVDSSGSCLDNAGNAADSIRVIDIDIDKTKPTSVVNGFTDGATFYLGDTLPIATCSDNDNLSGIATGGTLSGPTGSGTSNSNGVGTFTFSCNGAVDNASNTQTVADTKSYHVVYVFGGFFDPVNNPGWTEKGTVINKAIAGKTIPLKWRLTDANGRPILNLASVTVKAVGQNCSLGSTTDLLEEYASGSSGLQNLGNGYYQFNWSTPKSYASSCKTLQLILDDESVHTADFQFTK